MPTSLVTGGAGFLGSHLCDYLLGRGHRVICVDNLETGSLTNIEHISNGADFRFEMLDITSHFDVDEPIDFVYHMASPASPIDYARLPLHTLKVGAYGTHNSLGLAKAKRARFLLAYLRQQGVNTCIARIFNTYGSKMRPNDGRAVPTFLRQALTDRPVTVFGDGSQTRSFCYVDDLVRGLVLLAESEVHDPVNLGNPDEMALVEMAKLVIELTESRSEIVFEALPIDDPQVRQPDISRAKDLLGWEPEIDLREGLTRTIAHYTGILGEAAAR
jgi:dTDP-glucose 4,6-dehydratase